MVQRNNLPSDDKKYTPLHRPRSFDDERRKLLKYTNGGTWYTGERLGDRFKDDWKHWITTKEQRWRRKLRKDRFLNGKNTNIPHHKGWVERIETTSVMFVPSTVQSKLMEQLEGVEQNVML